MASIGFHGSSMKNGANVLPAVQIMLGGGVNSDGEGEIAERVVKVPSKKAPEALRQILDDYDENALDGEYYKDYFKRQGKMYFYNLLKPLANLEKVSDEDYIDWGQERKFFVQTAVGECAGVIIDLVSTLLFDSDEKLAWADQSFKQGHYADSIYHSYNVFINSAKAMLLGENVKNNSQMAVIKDFDRIFVENESFSFPEGTFREHVLQINKHEPSKEFAEKFLNEAKLFLDEIKSARSKQVAEPA
jgi:sulfite reductase (ferredoxin)